MSRFRCPAFAFLASLFGAGCPDDPKPPRPAVEIDTLQTLGAFVGGNPLFTAVVTHCDHVDTATAFANGITVAQSSEILLFEFQSDSVGSEDLYDAGARLFQMFLPADQLGPDIFGLPASFDLVVEIECGAKQARSAPFSMVFLPAAASLAPPFTPNRFWADDHEGDLLVCDDTRLIRFVGGAEPAEQLDVSFPCGTSNIKGQVGERRYLKAPSMGIAAIDPGPTLAWTRPMLLIDAWTDPIDDPIALFEEGDIDQLVVLDHTTGVDTVGPIVLPRPLPYHATPTPLYDIVARAPNRDILVIVAESVESPPSLTCLVQRFSPDGDDLGLLPIVQYNWQASSRKCEWAEFDQTGDHIFVMAAPDNEETAWVQKVELTTGQVVWPATAPDTPWRYPLAEFEDRVLVMSEDSFAWLQTETGQRVSAVFQPESGNSFLYGLIEADGSLVLLADPVANMAEGLYLFAPSGTTTIEFHANFPFSRWMTGGWSGGTLLNFLNEIHWLYSQQGYADLLNP